MLQSHPHQSIAQHLMGVWENVRGVLERHAGSYWASDELRDITMITCICHDLGKSTRFFQNYMDKISQGKKIKGGPDERHSLLSSIIGYYQAKTYLERTDSPNHTMAFYVFVAIKEHHGNLIDFNNEKNSINQDNLELLGKQANSINFVLMEEELKPLLALLPEEIKDLFHLTKETVLDWIKDFNSELAFWRRRKRKLIIRQDDQEPFTLDKMEQYFIFNFLFSLLLEGDKSQAGIGEFKNRAKSLDERLVEQYKSQQNWPESELNNLRQVAYEEVDKNIQLCKNRSLFSITLPTGLGKTLIAYNLALRLRNKRGEERKGNFPRIIYSLPFLSVIDQNLDIFEKILENAGIDQDHTYILKHHHLSSANYMDKSDQEEVIYNPNASKLLIEGWNSEIIVTTFIQLFESMISCRNRTLRRFHKLSNAIILIDEIQAIPVKYWELIRFMLLFISKRLNTDIVLITATQPRIFLPEDQVLELCQSGYYFSQLNRINMNVDLTKLTIDEFVDQLFLEDDKSYLFILNTIGSAKKLYELLFEKNQGPIGFLSTQVVMKHRKERIKDVKNSRYRIVVSTQMVEAGVDIDFDVVYRDFAPLDSINQSSGRCNRNNRSGIKGDVRIIKLWNGIKPYSEFVYDKVLLKTTEKIFEGVKETVQEREFLGLIDTYFNLLRSRVNQDSSQEILHSIEELCYDSDEEQKYPISKFKLIEDKAARESVFIEIDEHAQAIWQDYEEILNIEDPFKRQNDFSSIKNQFYDYVISIPITYDLPPEVNNFRYVGKSVIETYYDFQLGFKDKAYTMIW